MVLNMDSELQRLICVSVEKMTREPGSSGSRKDRGLDLRKALLVAHVLQDMRTAYISDDYQVLANTVCPGVSNEDNEGNSKRTVLLNQHDTTVKQDVLNQRKRKFLSDDWTSGEIERPPRSQSNESSFMTSPYRCPSGTQSCLLTCSDATMSKISQMTHPIPVSINTSYILSHQASKKDENDDMPVDIDDEDTPAVSEHVEVTSSNDVEPSDSETVESEVIHCEDVLNIGTESPEVIIMDCDITVKPLSDVTNTQGKSPSISCPLPRKKRPLPKEFLEQENTPERESKRIKNDCVVPIVTSSSSSVRDVAVTSSYVLNTTTATTLTQSTALSQSPRTSLFVPGGVCSTATSSVCTTTLVTPCSKDTNPDAKVVVEKMQKHSGLWSWSLPATCTQQRFSRLIMDGVYRAQLAEMTNIPTIRDSNINAPLKGLVAV